MVGGAASRRLLLSLLGVCPPGHVRAEIRVLKRNNGDVGWQQIGGGKKRGDS